MYTNHGQSPSHLRPQSGKPSGKTGDSADVSPYVGAICIQVEASSQEEADAMLAAWAELLQSSVKAAKVVDVGTARLLPSPAASEARKAGARYTEVEVPVPTRIGSQGMGPGRRPSFTDVEVPLPRARTFHDREVPR